MMIINAYPMCLAAEESVDHVLVHCSMAQHVWNSILSGYDCSCVFPRGIGDLF